MLGPGNLTTHLADLGADVIKVEPPQGDYGRRMTWPIVEGVSLLFLHISRGKKSIVLDLRTDAGRDTFLELVRDADAVVEAMRPGGLERRGPRLRGAAQGQPADRVLHDLGLRRDRPVPRHAEPRHRVRRVGRHRAARRSTTTASRTCPSTCRSASTSGPVFGALGLLAGVVRAREIGRGLPARDRAVGRGRRDRLAAQRDVARVRASGVGGHRQRGRQLRAARAGHRRHGSRRALPVLRDHRRPHPLHGVRARVLEELLRRHRPARAVRTLARLAVRRPRARQHRAARDPARRVRDEVDAGVARVRARAQHADRAREHAEDAVRRPAVPGPLRPAAGRARSAPTCSARRSSSSTRRCRCRRRRRPSASTPSRCCATCSVGTTSRSPRRATAGAFGET